LVQKDWAPHRCDTLTSSLVQITGQAAFDTALAGLMLVTLLVQRSIWLRSEEFQSANADSSSSLGQFLDSVSSALSNNDITAAQTALTTLESQPAPSASSAAPPLPDVVPIVPLSAIS
jgi:hypothetical protein